MSNKNVAIIASVTEEEWNGGKVPGEEVEGAEMKTVRSISSVRSARSVKDKSLKPYHYEATFKSFVDPQEARAHHNYYTWGKNRSTRPTFNQMDGHSYRHPSDAKKLQVSVDDEGSGQAHEEVTIKKFGTWDGVFTSCLLNIFGVIMFLRVGWVVGQAGIGLALVVIWVSTLVVLTTALSMSAICTNGKIEAGGAYYLISRSLGPSVGGAIGVIFSVGNSVAVALYVIGFMETLVTQIGEANSITGDPINDIRIYGVCLVTILLLIALIGVGWVLKLQFFLLLLLIGAIICFFIGTGTSDKPAQGVVGYGTGAAAVNLVADFVPFKGKPTDFVTTFGVFFPAVTGIMAGANISGDLKNPSEAIPKGTLSAVGISSVTYSAMAIVIGMVCVRDAGVDFGLHNDLLIMAKVSVWDGIIFAGIYAATFSSALASIVGAPRILMSVASDDLLPFLRPFKKVSKKGDPIRAYFVTYIISCACVLIGELNAIAPLITMFFMMTYALINLACLQMSVSKSPGWRPEFRWYNKWTALAGFVMCLAMMFILDYIYAIVASFVAATLYLYIDRKAPTVSWGSGTEGRMLYKAIKQMLSLNEAQVHVKNFRPCYLVLSGDPDERPNLISFMHTLHKGHGCVFLADIKVADFTIQNLFDVRESLDYGGYYITDSNVAGPSKMKMFYDRILAPTFRSGCQSLIQSVGVGRLRANTLAIGYKTDWKNSSNEEIAEYVGVIRDGFKAQMGVMILRNVSELHFDKEPDPFGTIDVWWLLDDGGLTILIPHILAKAEFWKTHTDGKSTTSVRLFLVSESDHAVDDLQRVSNLLRKFRINWATPEVLTIGEKGPSEDSMAHYDNSIAPKNVTNKQLRPDVTRRWVKVSELIKHHSKSARVVFCSMPFPRENVDNRDFMSWLEVLSEDMPPMVLMRGSGQNVLTWYSE